MPQRPPPSQDRSEPVRQRLLEAARTCFLADDYHDVSTRRIADLAGANVSMIRYYFGSKGGLFEEMIRETLQPLLDVLDGDMLATPAGFADYFALYYRTMLATPEFPRLILKVLALRAGLAQFNKAKSQGASTITMQVARNFYLSTEKTFTRKVYEILLALKIESQLSKEQILEVYMNQIFLGQRAYGFAAASEIYFGKPLSDITVAEAAMLAGLPQAPSAYNPVSNPRRATRRQQYIIDRMVANGFISDEQAETARREHDEPAFSAAAVERLAAATRWLAAWTDPQSGDAPNLGANDGARLFVLDGSAYRDFRPSLRWAARLFLDAAADAADERLAWLGLGPSARGEAGLRTRATQLLADGGYRTVLQTLRRNACA